MSDTANPWRPIGILGGMGPDATVLLMQKVIDAVSATDDRDHLPLMVHQNPQVPSRVEALLDGTGPSPAPVLADMARTLEAAGAHALAMACNTAHHYADAIENAVDIPFLDMIQLTARRLARKTPGATIGILASPAVEKTGLYDRAFTAEGLTTAYPQDREALLTAIRAVKSGRPEPDGTRLLRAASQDLADRGATLQVIACTEFSTIAHATAPGVAAIDALDVLVEAIVAAARA